jgi:hypothetical protein
MPLQLPVDVIETIAMYIKDHKTVLELSMTCKAYYLVIITSKRLWYNQYQHEYPLSDMKEYRWFIFYLRRCAASQKQNRTEYVRQIVDFKEGGELPSWINWYDAFVKRYTLESRWCKARFTEHPVASLDVQVNPPGLRLQSVVITDTSDKKIKVASQRVVEGKDEVVWIVEDVHWGTTTHRPSRIARTACSDSYLMSYKEDRDRGVVIFIWHLDALSSPPRLIEDQSLVDIRLCDRWLFTSKCVSRLQNRRSTHLYDLATGHVYDRVIISTGKQFHIQMANKNSVWIFSIVTKHEATQTTVFWQLQRFLLSQTKQVDVLADGVVSLEKYSYVNPEIMYVDQTRVLLLERMHKNTHERSPVRSTLVLLRIDYDSQQECVSVYEQWSAKFLAHAYLPVISRNLIIGYDIVMASSRFDMCRLITLDKGESVRIITTDSFGSWYHLKTPTHLMGIRSRFYPSIFHSLVYESTVDGFRVIDLLQPERTYTQRDIGYRPKEPFEISSTMTGALVVYRNMTPVILDFIS